MTDPALIAADWGSTNFRLFLYAADGTVVAHHTANLGLKNLQSITFEQALLNALQGDFDHPEVPILLSGMVDLRQGWIETACAPCPIGIAGLAQRLVRAPSASLNVRIVPGLFAESPGTGLLSVMRGEETQIFGLLDRDRDDGIFVLPGTHSKWAVIENRKVRHFWTYMTGEMFQALKRHSILGLLMRDDVDDAHAFLLGVDRAMHDRSLLSLLFTVRTEGLFHTIAPESLSSYLSGILIGSEITAEVAHHGNRPIHLIGDDALLRLYDKALRFAGYSNITPYDGITAAATGLWAIHRLAEAS